MTTKHMRVSAIVLALGLFCSAPASAETYEYDAAGRLTKTVFDDGSMITYTYDAAGNRINTTRTTVTPAPDGGGSGSDGGGGGDTVTAGDSDSIGDDKSPIPPLGDAMAKKAEKKSNGCGCDNTSGGGWLLLCCLPFVILRRRVARIA